MSIRKTLLFLLAVCQLTAIGRGVTNVVEPGPDRTSQAEHAFALLLRNQTDSLYSLFAESVRTQVSPQQLENGMHQVEQVLGAYQRHGAFERQQHDTYDVYTSVVDFERGQLAFVVSFDEEGKMQGMRLMPLPTGQPADSMPLPADAVELDDTVRTAADIALPCSVVLSGRSTRPPMVVFVHGSGPTDRNETVMANSPFLDLSRQLAQRGISSLRYDKRTFVYQKPVASMDDETTLDAIAAVQLAHTYADRVFLVGHSLGAMMAPEIATRCQQLDGIVMMAGPARDLSTVVDEQLAYLSSADATAEQRQAAIEQMRLASPHYLQPQHQVETAQRLSLPMLIMQGGRDYQVTMQDFGLWRQALSGKPSVTFRDYPELNHLFLPGEGKSTPQEYLTRGTIPARVADDIAEFMAQTSKLPNS